MYRTSHNLSPKWNPKTAWSPGCCPIYRAPKRIFEQCCIYVKKPCSHWNYKVFSHFVLVLQRGFEPRTPCLKGRCSAYWATGACLAGMAGLEPTISESKSEVLPLHYIPPSKIYSIVHRDRAFVRPLWLVGWVKGLEPSTPGTTIRCSNQLSYTHHIFILARQEGFEPPTYCLEGSCSILLSYWRMFPLFLERAMGIEPTYPAWKAGVLPLDYTCINSG